MNSLVQGRGSIVLDSQDQVRFETLVLPYFDAAFNLARWLLRSGVDAEDVSVAGGSRTLVIRFP